MRRWLFLGIATLIGVTACSSQPTPTPTNDVSPTSPVVTVVPIPTLLPTVTPIPVQVAPTALPAAATVPPTNTRNASGNPRPVTRLGAPTLLEPLAGALYKDGNDIPFRYASVGKLEPNQCYLLHIELAVPNLEKGNRGDDFLDVANCGDAGPAGRALTFTLFRGKFITSPNYGTILNQTQELMPEARMLKMTWKVRVVQNNGRAADGVHYNTVALSPDSPVVEFDFQP